MWFFPIFSYKQSHGGSYHESYKLVKERFFRSPNSDAVASFLQEFCLRKKFLQDTRNLARILHLVKVKKVEVFAIFGQGEILILKKMLKFLSFFGFTSCFRTFQARKIFEIFFMHLTDRKIPRINYVNSWFLTISQQ